MATLLTIILTILALPMIIVLFIGLFVTGIGAVLWIIVKLGWIMLACLFAWLLVWIIQKILE